MREGKWRENGRKWARGRELSVYALRLCKIKTNNVIVFYVAELAVCYWEKKYPAMFLFSHFLKACSLTPSTALVFFPTAKYIWEV